MKMIKNCLIAYLLCISNLLFGQYTGSDYAGYISVDLNLTDCSYYFGGNGIGVANAMASNSTGCSMFVGGNGVGYQVVSESELSNCIMFQGDEGVGYFQELFINPLACLPYRASELAGVGYTTRKLSDFVEVCTIITLGQGLSPLVGKVVNYQGQLNWDTYFVYGVSHFDVFRSLDGLDWKKIGKVDAINEYKEEINYQFVDISMSAEQNYYRIQMHYEDGSVTLSNIILLEMDGEVIQKDIFTIYPNPGSVGSTMKIKSWNQHEWSVRIRVFDNIGSCLLDDDVIFGEGGAHYSFNTHKLAAGTYSVTIESKEDNTSLQLPFVLIH